MIEQAFLRNTKALTEVKHILSIMHSFTNIHELGFKDLVEPENVESSYLSWLKLYRKWDGNERSSLHRHPFLMENLEGSLLSNQRSG